MGMRLQLRAIDEAEARSSFFDPNDLEGDPFEDEDGEEHDGVLNLDKLWHALHFVLTGSADPINDPLSVLFGRGEAVGGDFGYGPPLLVPAYNVAEFHRALDALSNEELRVRYDPVAMQAANIYIADALALEGEEGWLDVVQHVDMLRAFVKGAASDKLAMITLIS